MSKVPTLKSYGLSQPMIIDLAPSTHNPHPNGKWEPADSSDIGPLYLINVQVEGPQSSRLTVRAALVFLNTTLASHDARALARPGVFSTPHWHLTMPGPCHTWCFSTPHWHLTMPGPCHTWCFSTPHQHLAMPGWSTPALELQNASAGALIIQVLH